MEREGHAAPPPRTMERLLLSQLRDKAQREVDRLNVFLRQRGWTDALGELSYCIDPLDPPLVPMYNASCTSLEKSFPSVSVDERRTTARLLSRAHYLREALAGRVQKR